MTQPSPKNKLLLSVELSRHGERQPGVIFPLAKVPADNFSKPHVLTRTGAHSHYSNGKSLRAFFDSNDNFLSSTYSADEVYVQTTDR